MVNTGKPSTGCHLCRKRKLKCGEERPQCLRCIKIGAQCPGYRSDIDLNCRYAIPDFQKPLAQRPCPKIKTECTTQTQAGSFGEWRPQAAFKGEIFKDEDTKLQKPWSSFPQHSKQSSQGMRYISKKSQTKPYIIPALSYDIESQTVCLFFHDFVGGGNPRYECGFYKFLPEVFLESESNSSLQKAIKAVSSLNFANRRRCQAFLSQSRIEYGEALNASISALRDPATMQSDDTLLSCWVLGLFQLVLKMSSQPTEYPVRRDVYDEWRAHIMGMLALLQTRGDAQFHTERGRQLFQCIQIAITVRSLLYGEPEPEPVTRLAAEMYASHGLQDLTAARVTEYIRKTTTIRAEINSKLENFAINDASDLADLMRQSETAEDAMIGWNEADLAWLRIPMAPMNPSPESVLPPSAASLAIYAYANSWVYLHYMIIYTAKLLHAETSITALQCLLDVNTHGPSGTFLAERMAHHRSVVQATADDVIGSVAFAMGYDETGRPWGRCSVDTNIVGILQVFKPLMIIAAEDVGSTTLRQKEVAREALCRIQLWIRDIGPA